MEENLEREKKVRSDVEKARRKVEADLKMTQETVEELENVKRDLEDRGRKLVGLQTLSLVLITHVDGSGMSTAIIHVCDYVCLSVRTIKPIRLNLKSPNLAQG